MKNQAWLNTLPDEALRSLELRVWHEDEADAYFELLNEHHYLKCPHARKRHLSLSGLLQRQSHGVVNLDDQQS